MREILALKAVRKELLWGSEDWAISANPQGDCLVENGRFKGQTLGSLWKNVPELFGNFSDSMFPLLVKVIDAKQDLSIQVHPDDEYVRKYEKASMGKTECWYVLDCEPGATSIIGHHATSHQEMKKMIEEKRWSEFIREVPIHKGDFFQINPGCLHSIKGGTKILETQQNSDITYRVYDYDRLQNGQKRELHVKQSIDVISAPFVEARTEKAVRNVEGAVITNLISCEFYDVDKYEIQGAYEYQTGDTFTNVTVIEGACEVDGIPFAKGKSFVLSAGYGIASIKGDAVLIVSYVV